MDDSNTFVDVLGLHKGTYKLRKNMEEDGRSFQDGQTPHHIVQQGRKKTHAEYSRELLIRNGLDVEMSENGARLWGTARSQRSKSAHPGKSQAKIDGNYHSGKHIHSPENDKLVYQILKKAEKDGGAQGIKNTLSDIGKRMESGEWLNNFNATR